MSININSEATCRKAYLNYHCYGNTMNISAAEMGEITAKWADRLSSWQATVAKDENQYDFDDSDYANSKDKGKEQAKENTGFDGKADTGKSVTSTAMAGVGGVAAAALSCTGIVSAITKNANVFCGKVKTNTFLAACSGTALMGLTFAIKSMNPNKEAAEACQTLTETELPNAQAALEESQADMEDMANQLIELSDEANEANEDANDDIETEKTQYDMYKTAHETLKAKVDSGEALTEAEKTLYQQLIQYMTEAGANITETQEETTETVGEIYDDMGTYQDGYDYAAETMGEVEGITEYAAEFDEATKKNAGAVQVASYIGAAGSLGVVTTGILGIARGAAKMHWAEVAAGGVAVATGGIAANNFRIIAKDQGQYKSKAETEINIRKETQEFNTETRGIYDEEVDAYDGFMQGVEDLELEIPDDVAPPTDTTTPPTTGNGLPEGTPEAVKPEAQTQGAPAQTPQGNSQSSAPANAPATSSTTSAPTGNAQTTGTNAPNAGGEATPTKVLVPAQCAAAITTTLGLPAATSGDAFDPAQIPAILTKLAPGYDEETIRNVLNGVQTNNNPTQPAPNATKDDENGAKSPTPKAPTANQTNTQALKAKIAFYKPLLEQAALNGWNS